MNIIQGNKTVIMTPKEFEKLVNHFTYANLDMGTGDGNFVYKQALDNPDQLFVGIDPDEKGMREFSKKSLKKKLPNVLYVLGSFELIPTEFYHCFDKVTVFLPWGSLLKAIAAPTDNSVRVLGRLLKPFGTVELIFGYEPTLEPNETVRLNLERLNIDTITKEIIPIYERNGFIKRSIVQLSQGQKPELKTTWAKKTAASDRTLFRIELAV